MDHPAVLLGGPRALLLELANPLVAAGVAQYSDFESRPLLRLARTMQAMDTIVFGEPHRSAATARALRHQHSRIRGRDPAGRPFVASDPELLLWVHATLVDTVLVVDQRYLGVMSPADKARFYEESKLVAHALGIPGWLVPNDVDAFRAYMSNTIDRLVISDDARRLAPSVLHPQLGPASPVLSPLIATITADLLPARLRRQYGLEKPPLAFVRIGMGAGSVLTRMAAPRIPRPVLRFLGAWLNSFMPRAGKARTG